VLSRTAIDKIGSRLRDDPKDISAFAELALFREQVATRTVNAIHVVRAQTVSVVTPRAGKSARSIIEKLQRQRTLKLSQMQDVEGCRIIVDSTIEQDALASRLFASFEDVTLHDRRDEPSHGYRAIHLVPRIEGERYEVQVRTRLQHAWAEVAERLAGHFGQELKYGAGDEELKTLLADTSAEVLLLESTESVFLAARKGEDLSDHQVEVILRAFPWDNEESAERRQFEYAMYDHFAENESMQRTLHGWVLDRKRQLQSELLTVLRLFLN
jgi:putative GTP pyrophosphokinase